MVMKKPGLTFGESRFTRLGIQNNYPGFYRARVELTRDPKKIGRVKIRIPHLHGFLPEEGGNPEAYLHTSELPWAMPGDFSCAGYDYGQHMVPHVGTYVWVAFEAGDPDRPIYFGGIPYKEGGKDKKYGHIDDVPNKINEDHPDFIQGKGYYKGSDGSCPKDVYDNRETTDDITKQVLYKSVKGHTIVADDTDTKESFTIMDRLGQMLKFISPVTVNANKDNANMREIKSTYNEDTLHSDNSEVYSGMGVVLLKDIDNQIIRMVAEDGKDKIEVMSRDAELLRNCGAYLSSGENDVKFNIVAEDGDNRVIVVGSTEDSLNHIFIVEGGAVKTHLKLDAGEGMLIETLEKIKLVANDDVEVETQQKFKVNAKAGIEMETEGAFEVKANDQISLDTIGILSAVANGSLSLSTNGLLGVGGGSGVRLSGPNITAGGQQVAVNCCPHPPSSASASADTSTATPEYVPEGMSQQWEDAHDELYILYGDAVGTQGGVGLSSWDTDGGGTGGSGVEGEDSLTEEEVEELISECQNASRGGLRKSDTYMNNQSWRSEPHRGVDYAGRRGTALTSPVDGVVVFSGYGNSYGNYVIVKEDNANRWHLFGHMMSKCRAPRNAKVSAGTVVGLLSNTGSVVSSTGSCGCHVHYEVRTQSSYVKGGGHMNPAQWEGLISV